MKRVADWREILAVAMIFIALEQMMPARPSQRMFRRQWLNDTVYFLVNPFLIRLGVSLLLGWAMLRLSGFVPAGVGAFVSGQPLWLQAIAAILVADIGFYAHHRLFHAVPFLWRFHAVHHSIEELDWLAAHRVHPVDQIASATASLLPVILLGFSPEAMAIYGFTYMLQSHLVHANVGLDFGPLKWIIASPRYHHWHHANEPGAPGHNYSAQFLLMDWLFGTLRIPDEMPVRYGTDEPVPKGYPLQLLWPLTRPRPAEQVFTSEVDA